MPRHGAGSVRARRAVHCVLGPLPARGYFNHRDPNQGTCTNACRWNYATHDADIDPTTGEAIAQKMEGDFNFEAAQQKAEQAFLHHRQRPAPPAGRQGLPDRRSGCPASSCPSWKTSTAPHHEQQGPARGGACGAPGRSAWIRSRSKAAPRACTTWPAPPRWYRRAIDDAVAGRPFNPELLIELEGLSNRGYTGGLLSAAPATTTRTTSAAPVTQRSQYVGEVLGTEGLADGVCRATGGRKPRTTLPRRPHRSGNPSGNPPVRLQAMRNEQPWQVGPGQPLRGFCRLRGYSGRVAGGSLNRRPLFTGADQGQNAFSSTPGAVAHCKGAGRRWPRHRSLLHHVHPDGSPAALCPPWRMLVGRSSPLQRQNMLLGAPDRSGVVVFGAGGPTGGVPPLPAPNPPPLGLPRRCPRAPVTLRWRIASAFTPRQPGVYRAGQNPAVGPLRRPRQGVAWRCHQRPSPPGCCGCRGCDRCGLARQRGVACHAGLLDALVQQLTPPHPSAWWRCSPGWGLGALAACPQTQPAPVANLAGRPGLQNKGHAHSPPRGGACRLQSLPAACHLQPHAIGHAAGGFMGAARRSPAGFCAGAAARCGAGPAFTSVPLLSPAAWLQGVVP